MLNIITNLWNRAHQTSGVRMLATPYYIPDWPNLDNAPGIHHSNAIRCLGDDPHVVGNQ
jgi:hypothetical protein